VAVQLVARVRTFLARHPVAYWIVIGTLLVPLAAMVDQQVRELDQTRRSWGETRSVWVAAGALGPGDPIIAVRRQLPIAAVPAGAVTEPPGGRTAMQRITDGEPITIADVGDGLVDVLPDGWLAVAVVIPEAALPLRPGDHVAVYGAGATLADDAVVLDVGAASISIAVPAALAAAVGEAARLQVAVLALRRP
jgi:hypothetical protein